nr:preprotein translocase subunit SecA [bacterium]
MSSWLTRIFKGSNEAEVRRMMERTQLIDKEEGRLQDMSDDGLRSEAGRLRQRAQNGEALDNLLVPAFALVREAAVRTLGQRHYPVQMVGGMVLHQGRIAEMRTGEGKTLSATLPSFLNALPGKGVHIVTVNDYLARRDSEWMGKIHRFLGLEVGLIVHDLDPAARKIAYNADITYGTNSEFGFDYLRDNMIVREGDLVQRKLNYAIVDEVDSILIDEARTPLIISGAGEKSTDLYTKADRFAARMREGQDFDLDEKKKTINLTEAGTAKAESYFSLDNLSDPENIEVAHHINQALRARFLMKRDRDYVVQNGEVVIVDEFTGRLMTGRRYSEGLHQAIEAKEGVTVARESRTLATITYQNYFRMYDKLAGMTGTAKTEENEFRSIYNMDVVTIPTNKPMIRVDENDVIYRTERGKFNAVVEEIAKRHESGQPVLVGTVSVEKSEELSALLKQRGVAHQVLNAKYHEKEAAIIAQAGKLGAVTIATNMAGRGTDISLGGNPEFMARQQLRQNGMEEDMIEAATAHNDTDDSAILDARQAFKAAYETFKAQTDAEHEQVIAVGGLHIIGTERHESRRIDNQLRGRAGRQGDPGSSRFYISLEDDLMRLFGGERVAPMIERLGLAEDEPIAYGLLSKQIENAQKRIENNNFQRRKQVLEYDDVMNQQREIIYAQRREVLSGASVRENILGMLRALMEEITARYCAEGSVDEWDNAALCQTLDRLCRTQGAFRPDDFKNNCVKAKDAAELAYKTALSLYEKREAEIAENGMDMREIERMVLLRIVDTHWMDHIDAMDQLRDGIGLRGYAQRNPVLEYKAEGFDMFEAMIASIREQTVGTLFGLRVQKDAPMPTHKAPKEATPKAAGPARVGAKVGRNDPCPCGSGRKYKHCCGREG